MATGRQHAEALQLSAVPVGVLAFALTGDSILALSAGAGVLVGTLIDPDLDMVQITRSEWQMGQAVGIVSRLWVWFWWPYAWLVPHRSWISHKPLVGTVIRVAYLLFPLLAVRPSLAEFMVNRYFFIGLVGLATADVIHWLMDGLP